MNKFITGVLACLLSSVMLQAQTITEKKHYPGGLQIGDAVLQELWFENDGNTSSAVYVVDMKTPGSYFIKAVTNMEKGAYQWITDNGRATHLRLSAPNSGWQQCAAEIPGKVNAAISLAAGRHILRFTMNGNIPPLNDAISISRTGNHTKLDEGWRQFSGRLHKWASERPANSIPADKSSMHEAAKVLPNPEANYEHAIDTAFSYTTFHYVNLTAGVTYTFTTVNSTVDPVLHLFDIQAIDTRSWSDDDSGPGYESSLTITAPVTATYRLLVRPYNTANGITTVQMNGVNILTGTPLGGLRLLTTQRTGELNYFTARLSGNSTPDTRIFTMTLAGAPITAYNDDYYNQSNGNFDWFLASRIKKNFTVANSIVFVSAFNALHSGVCDVYMGNTQGSLPVSLSGSFPVFMAEDAIQSAPYDGSYNCISWSGGITHAWSWPPDPSSPWHVAGNELAGFDKFYSNTPMRYPGAWNYTRSGATSANAVVDLWKRPNGGYQHASVTKPGNNNPHGYDWESKPGSMDRQFHPRNALENNEWYGVVTNYYKFTGTYAWFELPPGPFKGFAAAADAIKAGMAVYENAQLSAQAQEKLNSLLTQTGKEIPGRFHQLYEAWKKTWAANASLSNPYAYSENAEYAALEAFCKAHGNAAMILVFEKYAIQGEHLNTRLLWNLTRNRYSHLMQEAKNDIARNPTDAQGRYKIHGDHDNGIRYIEKILQQLEIKPAEPVAAAAVVITAAPNPVKDRFTVTLQLPQPAQVSVKAVSGQTRNAVVLQKATQLSAGTYQFTASARAFAGSAGDMITIQVTINGELKTAKALVQ